MRAKDKEQRETGRSLLLNVDLEIESTHDLNPLVEALAPTAYSLERPPGRACFELSSAIAPTDPEALILEFVRLVDGLPPPARTSWERASKRVFDIGFQSLDAPLQQTHHLSPETLRLVASIGAAIAITIYAPERET